MELKKLHVGNKNVNVLLPESAGTQKQTGIKKSKKTFIQITHNYREAPFPEDDEESPQDDFLATYPKRYQADEEVVESSEPIVPGGLLFLKTIKEKTYVDKTEFIWHVLNPDIQHADVLLITRPRRFGKTTNMSALNCFLSDTLDKQPNTLGPLFKKYAIGKPEYHSNKDSLYQPPRFHVYTEDLVSRWEEITIKRIKRGFQFKFDVDALEEKGLNQQVQIIAKSDFGSSSLSKSDFGTVDKDAYGNISRIIFKQEETAKYFLEQLDKVMSNKLVEDIRFMTRS